MSEQANMVSQEHGRMFCDVKKSNLNFNTFGKLSINEMPHFKLAKRMMNKSRPILELGCAYGVSCKDLLRDGFEVIANDLDKRLLDDLHGSVEDEQQKSRLTIKHGNLVDLDFPNNSLNGILGFNVIHFLSGNQIRGLFHRCYEWLAPGGILVFSGLSAYSFRAHLKGDIAKQRFKDYFRNLRSNVEWPGEHYSTKNIFDENTFQYVPETTHLLSAEILTREAHLAGFNIYKVDYFDEGENGYIEPKDTNRMLFVSIMCIKEDY